MERLPGDAAFADVVVCFDEFAFVQTGSDIVACVCVAAHSLVHDIVTHDIHVLLVCQDEKARHVGFLHIEVA